MGDIPWPHSNVVHAMGLVTWGMVVQLHHHIIAPLYHGVVHEDDLHGVV